MLDNYRKYELVVRPLGRTPADEYYFNNAVWIEGREGNSYTIDIKNNSHTRALFIISVDGLDILSGNPAGPDSNGYVLDPYQSINIPGWKINNSEAAEFFFSRSRDSYVNAIGGSTANTGVIGAMIFSEYVRPAPHYYNPNYFQTPLSLNSQSLYGTAIGSGIASSTASDSAYRSIKSGMIASNSMSVKASSVSQDVGTGFGNKTDWNTTSVSFVKANPSSPDAVLALYYNTAKNLERMGIRLKKKRDISYQANPFPAYTTGCKPPPDWQG